ncbi:MAG TPA: hypothetical protein DEF45_17285 [Rhodopirellula sp.]|nr:hypothetical protein [Rhodopirellula sp.]
MRTLAFCIDSSVSSAKDEQTSEACPHEYVALKPTAPGFKQATDRGLIAPEAPVTFFSAITKLLALLVNPCAELRFDV